MLFTDSLEEAMAWHKDAMIGPRQTLGISDEEGVLSTITHTTGDTEEVIEAWVRGEGETR